MGEGMEGAPLTQIQGSARSPSPSPVSQAEELHSAFNIQEPHAGDKVPTSAASLLGGHLPPGCTLSGSHCPVSLVVCELVLGVTALLPALTGGSALPHLPL